MTKIEMLDRLALIREAVAALPDGARPLSVTVSESSDYIHISSFGETLEATRIVDVEGVSCPYEEYRADVLGVLVIWLVR